MIITKFTKSRSLNTFIHHFFKLKTELGASILCFILLITGKAQKHLNILLKNQKLMSKYAYKWFYLRYFTQFCYCRRFW